LGSAASAGNAAAREIGLSTSGPEHSAYAQFFRVLPVLQGAGGASRRKPRLDLGK